MIFNSPVYQLTYLKALFISLFILLFSPNGISQLAILDPSFNIGNGFFRDSGSAGTVTSIVIQPDNKIVIGGFFDFFNDQQKGLMPIRLNQDGSLDESFAKIWSPLYIFDMALQLDGKILIGNDFPSLGTESISKISRINSDGSTDLDFDIGLGIEFRVHSIVIQPDDKILAGGDFSTFNGTAQYRLVRLHPNGRKDNAFENGFDGSTNRILKLALQPDGKILVGGKLSYGNFNRGGLIRLKSSGANDPLFVPQFEDDAIIQAIKIQPDGKILVGGQFVNCNGVTKNNIVRLNTNGTTDLSFDTGVGFNGSVSSIDLMPDGRIIVGGAFTSFNGRIRNRLALLNSDGSLDECFNVGAGFNNFVSEVVVDDKSRILVGGAFSEYNGREARMLARLILTNKKPNVVATPDIQFACSANPFDIISLDGWYPGTTFEWTRSNSENVLGMPNSGTGDIFGTLINTTNEYQEVVFTIQSNAFGCPGLDTTAVVLVSPASVFEEQDTVLCSGDIFILDDFELTEDSIFTHLITNSMGCDSISREIHVSFKDPESLLVKGDFAICPGGEAFFSVAGEHHMIMLDGRVVSNNFSVTESGSYHLTAIDENNCEASIVIDISEYPAPEVITFDLLDTVYSSRLTMPAYYSSYDLDYQWEPYDDVLSCFDCPNPVLLSASEGIYSVTATNEYGCSSIGSVRVTFKEILISLPTVIANRPTIVNNGYFYVKSTIANDAIYSMSIYDRWGGLMFQGKNLRVNDENYGWHPNGDFSQGVYVYIIDFEHNGKRRVYKGTVTLL